MTSKLPKPNTEKANQVANAQAIQIAINYALAQVGKPYCYAGVGPNCYDCSGLVMMAWRQAHVYLPRVAIQQVNTGTPVTKDELIPGDLVAPDPGHIQIYIGGGKIVEAPRTGLLIRVVPMWGFWKACRLLFAGNSIPPADLNQLSGNPGCSGFGISTGNQQSG